MKSKELFKFIFGKENNITVSDIEEKILGSFKENSFFECKRIEDKQKANPRDLIMRELSAFLNKINSEGGILILGIDAKNQIPTTITGVEEGLIKNEAQLRDWIRSDISSIPTALEFPHISIETVNLSDKINIFLIEIHPQDTNVVYFDRRTNCAYKREADTTNPIPLEEAVKLIEEKRIAKVFMDLNTSNYKVDGDFVEYELQIVLRNRGNKPASKIHSFISFPSIRNQPNARISVSGMKDISSANAYSAYSHILDVLYPKRPYLLGGVHIRFEREKPAIQVSIEIDEERGYSRQHFLINNVDVKENQEQKFFSSY